MINYNLLHNASKLSWLLLQCMKVSVPFSILLLFSGERSYRSRLRTSYIGWTIPLGMNPMRHRFIPYGLFLGRPQEKPDFWCQPISITISCYRWPDAILQVRALLYQPLDLTRQLFLCLLASQAVMDFFQWVAPFLSTGFTLFRRASGLLSRPDPLPLTLISWGKWSIAPGPMNIAWNLALLWLRVPDIVHPNAKWSSTSK